MPLDDDYDNEEQPSSKSQKTGLKQVSSQKSIFDSMPKKPTAEKLEKQVKQIQDRDSDYQIRAADLVLKFKKAMEDKTLQSNKNIFARELEKDLLSDMIKLAVEINNDPNEPEGMGSMSWIVLLFKTCFSQRDKMNKLEYTISLLDKKTDPAVLSALIIKEINTALDSRKKSE